MRKKRTQQNFIHDSKEVHGDKYDYSEVKYVNHHFEDEENQEGNMRRVIKFRLKILD